MFKRKILIQSGRDELALMRVNRISNFASQRLYAQQQQPQSPNETIIRLVRSTMFFFPQPLLHSILLVYDITLWRTKEKKDAIVYIGIQF